MKAFPVVAERVIHKQESLIAGILPFLKSVPEFNFRKSNQKARIFDTRIPYFLLCLPDMLIRDFTNSKGSYMGCEAELETGSNVSVISIVYFH